MAKVPRYWGEFRSVAGTLYRVEILSDDASYVAKQVYFPHEMPVEIEWNEVDKLEPVQGSCMTLSLVSESDRQFIDLYSVEVGSIRADIYRDGSLYWSGMLDPELYEEAYSQKADYDVSFSFSDFAILDRIKWSMTGKCSIQDVLDTCIDAMGVEHGELRKYVSTKTSQYSSTSVDFSTMYVLCANFYDEDGEAMTMREVLDNILRPFALRIVQKNGHIYLYDLNAIHSDMATQEVEWDSTDAVLDADKVYNNVKVTFSPYAEAEMVKGTVDEKEESTVDSTNGRMIRMNYERDQFYNLKALEGFRFFHGSDYRSNMTLMNNAEFFQIRSIYSGSDETGVAWAVRAGDYGMGDAQSSFQLLIGNGSKNSPCGVFSGSTVISRPIIKLSPVYLGYTSYRRTEYKLRLNLKVLFDTRYNPFEDSEFYNEAGNYNNMQDWCNYGYVPFLLTLRDDNGTALCHYENKLVMESNDWQHNNRCSWVAGEGSMGCAYFCYYDVDDRKAKTGFGGWQDNKPIIGYTRAALPKSWQIMDTGEYIELPMQGGWLDLQIGYGVHQFDYKREVKNIYTKVRWVLYKEPTITLCRRNGTAIENKDIEDMAQINSSALEELSLDTIFGTVPQRHGVPNAFGQIFKADNSIVYEFGRADATDRLERLLIGTVYSQYATRHNMLSGTVKILTDMKVLTDASTSGKYIMLSEVQNLMQDTSEIKMSEFVADCYEGVEYE